MLRLLYVDAFEPKQMLTPVSFIRWGFEHGVLIISPDRPPSKYFSERPLFSNTLEVASKKPWGGYAIANVDGSGASNRPVPDHLFPLHFEKSIKNGPPVQYLALVLASVKDSHSLSRRVQQLLGFLEEDQVRQKVLAVRDTLMEALRAAARERRVLLGTLAFPQRKPSGRGYVRSPDTLMDANRFGKDVVVKIATRPEYLAAVRFTLAASRLRLRDDLPEGRVLGEELHGPRDAETLDLTRVAPRYRTRSTARPR